MRRHHLVLGVCLMLVPLPVVGDIVATRVLRVGTVIGATDIKVTETERGAADIDPDRLVGMEVRRVIYLGHPVGADDVGPPRIIHRNDKVTVLFRSRALELRTDARALGAGALGEYIDVLNLDSRLTVTARIVGPGVVEVGR